MSETPYRIASVLVFITILSVVRYYRWRAAQTGERISRAGESWPLFLGIRLSGLAMAVALLCYLMAPESMRWAMWPLPGGLRWFGAGLGLLCAVWMYWTLSNLDRNLTDTTHVRENARLVTSGPYRYVRHPMYVGLLLMFIVVSLLTANWFLPLVGLVTIVLLALRTPEEERQLEARFGSAYREYCARTGRFVPKLR